ncbi:MAG TPA: hypothetical protein VIX59_08505 [Candidatus Binataceae bacterium]
MKTIDLRLANVLSPTMALALLVALSLSMSIMIVPAAAHDMAAMGGSDAPNAMGAHMDMSAHMVLTPTRAATPSDIERANYILDTLRRALKPYRDYRVALAQGYQIFLPGIPQAVYHFTDYRAAGQEYQGHFDPARPGSLLYSRGTDGGYVLVGAMYSAPAGDTADQLDQMIPLSVCRWHAHVNICLPEGITLQDLLRGDVGADRADMPGMIPVAANPAAIEINHKVGFLADGRFGFAGKIVDEATCNAASGHFLPMAFGWMVHVYPFNGDDLKVAYGMDVPKPPAH